MKNIFKRAVGIILSVLILLSSQTVGIDYKTVYAASVNLPEVYTAGSVHHGFKLVSKKNMQGIKSTVMQFEHLKTGAKLMYVKNNDTQRVFDISFKTLAEDDTGVNHIIEHSLLDGSKKYPMRSPFKEMVKRSLGTFINAMTGNDYTTFPVASTNEADLKNLVKVYLDAVFNPKVIENPNIFKQEGWRYELPSKEEDLSINGVVYNEMKGNYSNPGWILSRAVSQSLFPNTPYKWDSGGNPDQIPKLTQERLVEVYRKNYNPSNSYIYIYGKLNIGKYLEFIDTNYLGKLKKTHNSEPVLMEKDMKNIPDKKVYYPSAKDSGKDGVCFSLNFVTGNAWDKDANEALEFIGYLLMGSENSPLKKELKDKKIVGDVGYSFKFEGIQPVFSIILNNSSINSKESFKKITFDTLKHLSEKGFEKNFLETTLKSYDIKNRTSALSLPAIGGRGLVMSQAALSTWIYGKDPTMYFELGSKMQNMGVESKNMYLKSILNKCLASNEYHSMVIMMPKCGLEEKDIQDTKRQLKIYKEKIDEDDLNKLVKDTQYFKTWQNKKDSKEELDKLPRLSLEDVKAELPNLKWNIENISGIKMLFHKTDMNRLSHVKFYFDTSSVPQDKIKYLTLLSSILGSVRTDKYDFKTLSENMNRYTGGKILFTSCVIPDKDNLNSYSPKIMGSLLVPDENISKSMDLVLSIINKSTFNEKSRIKKIIAKDKEQLEYMLSSGSGVAAFIGLNSYMGQSGKYMEDISGIPYYEFLRTLEDNFDSRWEEIQRNLRDVSELVFTKNNLLLSCSGDVHSQDILKKEVFSKISKIPYGKQNKCSYNFKNTDKNIAFSSPVKVQTVMQGGDFRKYGYNYSGKMMVLENIINMGYLWGKVRTDGGAYGTASSFSPNGMVVFQSISDPNIKETLQAFKGISEYLKNFNAESSEMNDYIIGTIRSFVNLKTSGPLVESSLCDTLYFTNSSSNDLLKYQKEALSTTPEDIRNYGIVLDKILKQNIYFVEGSRDKIRQNKALFKYIIDSKG